MKFKPITEEEAMAGGRPNPGNHKCAVVECEEGTSRAGNEMFTLTLSVNGYEFKDWVGENVSPWKLRHLVIGILGEKKWDSGEVKASELVGNTIDAELYHEDDEYEGKPIVRVRVRDYIVDGKPAKKATKPKDVKPVEVADDDLPF